MIGVLSIAMYFKFKGNKMKLLKTQKLRNDTKGKGTFNAVRSNHLHEGIDIIVKPNEAIFAPFDGVIRQANPYKNDSDYNGLEIKSIDGKQKVKIFYCKDFAIGKIKKGEVMATAQNIALKYGKDMTPHIHVELRIDNKVIDPTSYFIS